MKQPKFDDREGYLIEKIAQASMSYTILGLVSGIFYLEFPKMNEFTGVTQLSVLHTHLLVLGMFFFLIVLLLEKAFYLSKEKNFKKFYILYNSGLGLTVLMMIIRGSMQVLGKGEHATISGMAGLGHIILSIGLFFFFQSLLSAVKKAEAIEQ
ncbi:MAG: DUF2871 domain-containing protein [Enterococcus aquimarinus]